jgi:hypothetical protein
MPVAVTGERVAVKVMLPPIATELVEACRVVMVTSGPLILMEIEFEVLER